MSGSRGTALLAGIALLLAAACWQSGEIANGGRTDPALLLQGLWLAEALLVALLACPGEGLAREEWLGATLLPVLVPLPLVRAAFVAVPVAVLIWVLTLPKEETTAPDSAGRWGGNLKIGAAAALIVQIVIYCLV